MSETIRRDELAAFLRARRARLRPGDVGLPDGIRRRTPGLRRQEVAQLAGMSIDYYIRLEQGRGPHPSHSVLSALARGFMLTRDERDYLFRVAGEAPPTVVGPVRELTPAIRYLLDSMPEVPAYVVDAKWDLLAWNRLATYFLSDLSQLAEEDRNMIRWTFGQPADKPPWNSESMRAFTRATVADLRSAYARYPGDPGIEALVTEMLGASPRFAQMWAAHDVEVWRRTVKEVESPMLGPLKFECQVLGVPETDQRIIVYCAEPGSPTRAVFARLALADTGAAPRS